VPLIVRLAFSGLLCMSSLQLAVAREGVILLHGLARSAKSMDQLERSLLAEGFEVVKCGFRYRPNTSPLVLA